MDTADSAVVEPEGPDIGVFCFTVNGDDGICLTNAPADLIRDCQQLIETRWTIQQTQTSRQESRFKLKGTPFKEGTGRKMSVESRVLILQIFKFLTQKGYVPLVSADVSIDEDRTSVFFQLTDQPMNSSDFDLVCLSPSSDNHVQLVNPSGHLVTALQRAAMSSFPELTVKKLDESLAENLYEARLVDGVWDKGEHQIGVGVRRFILELVAEFEAVEYRFYGTINLKGIVDCLFFISRKPKGAPLASVVRPYATTNVKWKQSPHPQLPKFWVLSLDRSDRIRVITSGSHRSPKRPELHRILDVLKKTIATYWLEGLEREGEYFDSYELQLGGAPWDESETKNGLAPRMLMTVMFEELLKIGWKVHCTVDITRDLNDKSIFVFKSAPPECWHHFCMALDGYDKLRLVRYTIPVLQEIFKPTLQRHWQWIIKEEKMFGGPNNSNLVSFNLEGYPWTSNSEGSKSGKQGKILICYLLKKLIDAKWQCVSAADVNSGPKWNVYSLFFSSKIT